MPTDLDLIIEGGVGRPLYRLARAPGPICHDAVAKSADRSDAFSSSLECAGGFHAGSSIKREGFRFAQARKQWQLMKHPMYRMPQSVQDVPPGAQIFYDLPPWLFVVPLACYGRA